MFILIDRYKNNVVFYAETIDKIVNRIGFLNTEQYYNHLRRPQAKLKHITDKYEIMKVNQREFFQKHLLCDDYYIDNYELS